jgi:dienelactone hydrolase
MNAKNIFVCLILGVIGFAHAQPRVDVIPEDQLSYTVHRANPWSNKPASTVMIGHGCSGIVKSQTQDFVQNLTSWGHNVVVVDSWGPRGIKLVCKMKQPYYFPEDRVSEFYAIADRIKQEPWHNGRLGYIGFSHGGSLGLALAGRGRVFDAIVSYYPWCGSNAFRTRQMQIPTQMHVSYGDTWTPAQQCESVIGNVERVVHKDATHAWDIHAPDRLYMGEPLRYHAQADRKSKDAARQFFEDKLK